MGEIVKIKIKTVLNKAIKYSQKAFFTKNMIKAAKNGWRIGNGTYDYGNVEEKTKKVAGYKCNKIIITNSSVVGTGDLTVFCDRIGDHDNKLKKGDCATKMKYDRPKDGTKIMVTNKLNDVSHAFTKNDVGSLDNAVIDIWKTGIELLSIKSKDYNHIKVAARYYYGY